MSRIDYITIGIVSVCVLAIGFLVYKMTDLFNPQNGSTPVETSQNTVEVEEEGDIYDYETDGPLDTTSTEVATSDTFAAPAPKPATSVAATATATPKQTPAAPKPATSPQTSSETDIQETEEESAPAASAGAYMVFAGTFKQKINAEKRMAQLRKSGYDNATIEIFDRGRYAVVIAGRFDNMQDAEALKEKLQTDGINAVIKVKEQ